MTFIDVLRQSRSSRAAVLHEFRIQYDPNQRRIHAFFEGDDDVAFYRRFLDQYLPPGTRLYVYRCEGKQRVYDAFGQITQRNPNIKGVLFFVDKDLEDILGEPWPTDPRIFVTDVYSIENYLVSREVLGRLYSDSIRLRDVHFQIDPFLDRFDEQLAQFHRLSIPLMAWVVMMRRAGLKPNLNDVNAGELFELSDDCSIHKRPCGRVEYLTRVTGVPQTPGIFRRLRHTSRELNRIHPKRFVRGKFEAWFFVEFWKHLTRRMQALAKETNGNLVVKVPLEKSNFVTVLVARATMPRSLDLFLGQHFPPYTAFPASGGRRPTYLGRWAEKALLLIRRIFAG